MEAAWAVHLRNNMGRAPAVVREAQAVRGVGVGGSAAGGEVGLVGVAGEQGGDHRVKPGGNRAGLRTAGPTPQSFDQLAHVATARSNVMAA